MSMDRQYRIDHGRCPECGEESAPYYLCTKHREIGAVGRMMNQMAERGVVKKERIGRHTKPEGFNGRSIDEFTWAKRLWELDPDDKRFRPRLGRRPVDLDETLIGIFQEAGRPLQMEEIVAAWGKLRSKRKTRSLAGDMAAIIAAQQRREERNAKRAAVARRTQFSQTRTRQRFD